MNWASRVQLQNWPAYSVETLPSIFPYNCYGDTEGEVPTKQAG